LVTVKNLLVVEDDTEWCDIYASAARQGGVHTVRTAEDLSRATALVDEMQFAVAFIDIGLEVGDDRNTDGLRVMDKIRSVKDETSIIVITGRSGTDVLPITRESIMRYNAHYIASKREITPEGIEEALKTGLELFEEKKARRAVPAHNALKGDLGPLLWEDQMIRGTGVHEGIRGLHEFLDHLASEFLPLVSVKPGASVARDAVTGVMHGAYWSRSIGAAIVICFADLARAESDIEPAKSGQRLLGIYDVGATLNESSAHGVRGAVFALCGVPRSSFAQA
jgi:ActR/RegA family two-component response regulator